MEPEKNMEKGNERIDQPLAEQDAGIYDLLLGYPYGVLRCTDEEFPKVLYANEQMLEFLGISEESEEWRDFVKNNLFFMLPHEERRAFRSYLTAAREASAPVAMEHDVHNGRGGVRRLQGWVRAVTGRTGKTEYNLLYMEVPEERFSQQQRREWAYLRALKGVYDLILKYDRAENTLECVHKGMEMGIPLVLGARIVFTTFFIQELQNRIREKDRGQAAAFFHYMTGPKLEESPTPYQTTFHMVQDGQEREYHFVMSKLDDISVLLCGRDVTKEALLAVPEDELAGTLSRPKGKAEAAGGSKRPKVTIHTFGYFDVFVDGEPVVFRYEKSKEMLAILVDRKGSFVSNPYFTACLWEREEYGEKIQNRCRQTAYRMMETLKRYGIEHIIEKVSGRRRIVPELVDCDYFNYLQGKQMKGQIFNGAYMSDYSWGEATLSTLVLSSTAGL